MPDNQLHQLLRHHVTGAIERGDSEPIVAVEITTVQRARLTSLVHAWDAVTAYAMPADHRHSPGCVLAYCQQSYHPDWAVVRLHPDGRREAITDLHNQQHLLADAREEGTRCYA